MNEIASLIDSRLKELRIDEIELLKRCGYRNISKGLRRLEEVREGGFESARFLLENLASGLSVGAQAVTTAVEATIEAQRREDGRSYRESFCPHAIIQTDKPRPEPLFVAMIMGVERILRIALHEDSPPITYARQALLEIRQRLRNERALPAFGKPLGFTVNYKPNLAISFSLDGVPYLVHDRTIHVGTASLHVRGKILTQSAFEKLVGSDES